MVKFSKKIFLVLLIMNYGMTMENHYNSNRIPSLQKIIKKGSILMLSLQNVLGYNNNEHSILNNNSLGLSLEISGTGRNLQVDVTNDVYGNIEPVNVKPNSKIDVTSDLYGPTTSSKINSQKLLATTTAEGAPVGTHKVDYYWNSDIPSDNVRGVIYNNFISNNTFCINKDVNEKDCVLSILSKNIECQKFLQSNSGLSRDQLIQAFVNEGQKCAEGILFNLNSNTSSNVEMKTHNSVLNLELFKSFTNPLQMKINSNSEKEIQVSLNNSFTDSQNFAINGNSVVEIIKNAALINLDQKTVDLLSNDELLASVFQNGPLVKVSTNKNNIMIYDTNPFVTDEISNAALIQNGEVKFVLRNNVFMNYFNYNESVGLLRISFRKEEKDISNEYTYIKLCFTDKDNDEDIFDLLKKQNKFQSSCLEIFETDKSLLDIVKKLLYKNINTDLTKNLDKTTNSKVLKEESSYFFEINDENKKPIKKILPKGFYKIDLIRLLVGMDNGIITAVNNSTFERPHRLLQDNFTSENMDTLYVASSVKINYFPSKTITNFMITLSSLILFLEGIKFLGTTAVMGVNAKNKFTGFNSFFKLCNFYHGQYHLLYSLYISMITCNGVNLANDSTLITYDYEKTLFALQLCSCISVALTGLMMIGYNFSSKNLRKTYNIENILNNYSSDPQPKIISNIDDAAGTKQCVFNILGINIYYSKLLSILENKGANFTLNAFKTAIIAEITEEIKKEKSTPQTQVDNQSTSGASTNQLNNKKQEQIPQNDVRLNTLLSLYLIALFAKKYGENNNPSLFDSTLLPGSFISETLENLYSDIASDFKEGETGNDLTDEDKQIINNIMDKQYQIEIDGYLIGQRPIIATICNLMASVALAVLSGLQI